MPKSGKWNSSEDEASTTSWDQNLSISMYLEQWYEFDCMVESIPSVLSRMMLPELEKLQSHLVKGEVLVTNQNQRKMIDEELHKTIAKRKETLETSELRKEVLMPKRIRNTRGLINMEKSTRKLVHKQESGPVESKDGQMEPEVEKPEVKSGWSQNESKPDVEPEVSGWNQSLGPQDQGWGDEPEVEPEVSTWTPNPTTQQGFLSGGVVYDLDGIAIKMEKVLIKNPDFYAGVALDMYGSSLLVLNNNMKLISENGTFSGTLLCNDEINQVKILKSHLPIMEKSGGPINHLAKAMVGTTMRLEGTLRNWMSRRNHFGRICDFQTFLRRVHLKQELDDLMLFSLTPVQAS